MDYLSSVDTYKFERIVHDMQARLATGRPVASAAAQAAPVTSTAAAKGGQQ